MNSQAQHHLNGSQTICRYICDSKFIRKDNTLRHQAFGDTRNTPISVFIIDQLKENQVWLLGRDQVAMKRKRNLYGGAQLTVIQVRNIKLIENDTSDINQINKILEKHGVNVNDVTVDVVPNTEIHPRHAEITYEPFEKSIEIHIAKKLARLSSLRKPSLKYIQDLGLHIIRAESAN